MRADAVGLAHIEAHICASKLVWWGGCGQIQADLLKINNVVGCRESTRMQAETYCAIHIRVNCCGMQPDGLFTIALQVVKLPNSLQNSLCTTFSPFLAGKVQLS